MVRPVSAVSAGDVHSVGIRLPDVWRAVSDDCL
jgi:hypothetical protein